MYKKKLSGCIIFTMALLLAGNVWATTMTPDQEIAHALHKTIERFANQEGEALFEPASYSPKVLNHEICGTQATFYGIEKDAQKQIDFAQMKQDIAKRMGVESQKLIQIVGDSNQFSEEGTKIGRKFVTPYFEGNHILEYGFTGYLTDDRKKLDVNSLLNEYVANNPKQTYRVLANVVGHSIHALEKWGCKVSPVSNYVVVYNKYGMEEGFTKFGDDVIASDNIQSPKDGDILLMLEGGPQSFKQAINVLRNDVPVKALFNIRSQDRRAFFSATEFFYLVKQELLKNVDLSSEEVKNILDEYLKTHEAWDSKKPDAGTKEALFFSTVDQFINEKIYTKLLDKVEIIDATAQ